ncbi:MAG TPA: matrixin family metalloprotease [Rhodoferax sp.]|jgi:hypothetical protein|nr:matrixin family metalloprotease [Rhodoferax sp.]
MQSLKSWLYAALLLAGTAQAEIGVDYSRTVVSSDKAVGQWVSVHDKEAWPGGVFKYYYNPQNQPANLTTDEVLNAIHLAARRWMGMCGVTIQYMGLTNMEAQNPTNQLDPNGHNVIEFRALTGTSAGSTAYTPWLVKDGRILHADIVLNSIYSFNAEQLDGLLTHEMGHALGLEHSEVSESVMFARPYHSYKYLRTLRGDDAQGCSAIYGPSENQKSNRVMNWAESVYPTILGSTTMQTGFTDGYLYRYYPSSNSFIGSKDGRALYYAPSAGGIQDVGALDDYMVLVAESGF